MFSFNFTCFAHQVNKKCTQLLLLFLALKLFISLSKIQIIKVENNKCKK